MSNWAPRRFWTETAVLPVGGGFEVRLDGRPVRTPARSPLHLPTPALAEVIAAEWQAQEKTIDPGTMPMTRTANSAIDKVAPQRAGVEALLAEYADTDLLCYRAAAPQELAARQAREWDPLLDWAAERFGGRLVPVEGVVHRPQDPRALAALAKALSKASDFQLAALNDLITLSGSLVIGLATAAEMLPADALWQRARVDELWQIEQWGADDEAEAAAAARRTAFLHAKAFHRLAS